MRLRLAGPVALRLPSQADRPKHHGQVDPPKRHGQWTPSPGRDVPGYGAVTS